MKIVLPKELIIIFYHFSIPNSKFNISFYKVWIMFAMASIFLLWMTTDTVNWTAHSILAFTIEVANSTIWSVESFGRWAMIFEAFHRLWNSDIVRIGAGAQILRIGPRFRQCLLAWQLIGAIVRANFVQVHFGHCFL